MTINYKNFDWIVVNADNASDKPNLRKHWDRAGIVEMVVVTGQPKRKVWTMGLYRMVDGSFCEVL